LDDSAIARLGLRISLAASNQGFVRIGDNLTEMQTENSVKVAVSDTEKAVIRSP